MSLLRRLTAVFLILLASQVGAAPKAERWALWDASDESRAAHIDHSAWQELLTLYLDAKHPSGIARFAYARVNPQQRRLLDAYLYQLTALDPRQFTRVEQRAYWINLYNALTVRLVLAHYPLKSITKLGPWYRFGPWDQPITEIAGHRLTLNDIEHRILRPLWRDPRLHYALNCASLGCPNLAAEAYTAKNSERLLDAGARAYINHPRGVAFEDGKRVLSKIYDWFAVDFGSEEVLRGHLIRYAEPALAQRLKTFAGKTRYRYDWDLNQP